MARSQSSPKALPSGVEERGCRKAYGGRKRASGQMSGFIEIGQQLDVRPERCFGSMTSYGVRRTCREMRSLGERITIRPPLPRLFRSDAQVPFDGEACISEI